MIALPPQGSAMRNPTTATLTIKVKPGDQFKLHGKTFQILDVRTVDESKNIFSVHIQPVKEKRK